MFDHEAHCPRCGAAFITCAVEPSTLCVRCTATQYGERLQGVAVRLFEPAPTQMPGQLALEP